MEEKKPEEAALERIERLYPRKNGKFDADAIVLRSVRLVGLVKAIYHRSEDIREVMDVMASEQGLMLSKEQIIAMINKGRRKGSRILFWQE
jgi:hypothetical protein